MDFFFEVNQRFIISLIVTVVVAALGFVYYVKIKAKNLSVTSEIVVNTGKPVKEGTEMGPLPIDPEALKREITLEELKHFRGNDFPCELSEKFPDIGDKPILISVNGEVYCVTAHPTGRQFYSLNSSYGIFAGCDATVCLARVVIDSSLCNTWNWESLSANERKVLADWVKRYRAKYRFVGFLKSPDMHSLDLTEYDCPPLRTL